MSDTQHGRIHRMLTQLRAALTLPTDNDIYATKDDDSDLEIRENTAGFIECVDCPLDGYHATWAEEEMAEHIQAHKRAGHRVPATAIPNLLRR